MGSICNHIIETVIEDLLKQLPKSIIVHFLLYKQNILQLLMQYKAIER